jgi:hypothetical protein
MRGAPPPIDGSPEAKAAAMARSAFRWRTGLLVAAVLLPGALYGLFERQARRLDALGEHGVVTPALVTDVRRQGGATYVDYEHRFGGETFHWNVGQELAPYPVGARFDIVVLREDPSLSRPGADRKVGTAEAAENRRGTRWVIVAFGASILVAALYSEVLGQRLRSRGTAELTDPAAVRVRLLLAGMVLVPGLLLVFGFHLQDAIGRGQSVWPVLLSIPLSLGILGGTVAYVLRLGPAGAADRARRLLAWVAPAAVALALLRAALYFLGGF